MQHLTKPELKELLKNVSNPRHKLMVLVAYWHGLRVSELINLTSENIRDGYVNVQRLKGSEHTIQPFVQHEDPNLDESAGLKSLSQSIGPQERLFPMTRFGFYKLIKRSGNRACLPNHKCHPHTLKHSIAMHTIKAAGIENVRAYLGHKSIASTGFYLKVSDDEASKAIAAAVRG